MSETNEEHQETEGILRRVRPHEPSAELRARVVGAARDAWHRNSVHVPWQIPIRRLAASVAAAVLMIFLANLYGNSTPMYRPAGAPTAGIAEPCDLHSIVDVHLPLIRYMATAGRPAQGGASTLLEYLEVVREALRETERKDASEDPALLERRSRLLPSPSSLHS